MRQNRTTLIYALTITAILLTACALWAYQRAEREVNAAYSEVNAFLVAHDRRPFGLVDAVRDAQHNGEVLQWPGEDGELCSTTCHAKQALTPLTQWGLQASGALGIMVVVFGGAVFSRNPRRNLINLGRDRIAINPRAGDAFAVIRAGFPRRTWGIMSRHRMRGTGRRQYGSAVVLGSPGRGKSNLLKSWLLSSDKTNFIVVDLKGDLYRTTAAHRATLGPVVCLDLAHQRGHALDPLQHATPADVSAIAALLVGGSTDFWTRSAANLAEAFILAAQAAKIPPVAVLLESARLPPVEMASYARNLIERVPENKREKLEQNFKKVLERAWDEKERGERLNNQDAGVLDGYSSAIKMLDIPEISTTLTQTTFDLKDLVRKRVTVYISLPYTEKPYKLPTEILMHALVRGVFDEADTERGAGENIILLADEAGVLKIPMFSNTIAEGRSRNFSVFAFIQAAGQLSQYTETNRWQDLQDVITHWIFLGSPAQDDVRRHLSEMCGTYDVRMRDVDGEIKEIEQNAFEEFVSSWKESHAMAILDYDRRYVITGKMVTPYSSKRLQKLMKQKPPSLPQLQVITPIPAATPRAGEDKLTGNDNDKASKTPSEFAEFDLSEDF